MGVEPLIALPPRVLVAGRLQCGAARAGVRRGHGECVELAHLARGSSKLFSARHAENGPFSREVGQNTILATWNICNYWSRYSWYPVWCTPGWGRNS